MLAAVDERQITISPPSRGVRMTWAPVLAANVISFTISCIVATILVKLLSPVAPGIALLQLVPFPVLSLLMFAMLGLYPGLALNPVEEIRSIVNATTITFLMVAITVACFGSGRSQLSWL